VLPAAFLLLTLIQPVTMVSGSLRLPHEIMYQGVFSAHQAHQRLTGNTTLPYPFSSFFCYQSPSPGLLPRQRSLKSLLCFRGMESNLSGFHICSSHPDLSGLIPILLLNYFRKSDFETFFEK
jgi:hypothetical protein